MYQKKGAILPDSVDFVQAQNCQVDLTHASTVFGAYHSTTN